MNNNIVSIILAAGLGKRMNSDIPKVLQYVNNKRMIFHVIDTAIEIGSSNILIIVGKYKDIIQDSIFKNYSKDIYDKIHFIIQPEPFGTGNAVYYCIDWLNNNINKWNTRILILSGNVPLISAGTLNYLINKYPNSNSLLTYKIDNPDGYGRIVLDFENNTVLKIIEHNECNHDEQNIHIINCGIYYLDYITLFHTLPKLCNRNHAGEYYLTDIVQLSFNKSPFFSVLLPNDKLYEIFNINNTIDLEIINRYRQ